jgi:hypothetical protein
VCTAETFSISSKNPPFLSYDDDNGVVDWSRGYAGGKMFVSDFVFVSVSGVRTITHRHEIHIDNWHSSFPCHSSTHAMCCGKFSCVFPSDAVFISMFRVMKSREETEFFDVIGNGCTQSPLSKNRTMPEQYRNGSDARSAFYDISLCDIMESNVEVMYDISNQKVYIRVVSRSDYVLLAVAIMTLYVVVTISDDIGNLGARTAPSRDLVQVLMCVALVAISELSLKTVVSKDGVRGDIFLTKQDLYFYQLTQLYIVVVCVADALTLWREPKERRGDLISAYLGVLSVVSGSFYGTFDTLTQVVIIFLVLASLFLRFGIHNHQTVTHEVQTLVDTMYIAAYVSIVLQHTDNLATLDLIPFLCYGALCLAIALSEYLIVASTNGVPVVV